MDTKVKSREWVKTAAIIFLAVLLVLTFFSNTIMNASLPEVAAQQVASGAINAKIRGSGTLSANETYDVTIAQTRKIASVKVREGQTVNAGDVLFVLEAEDSEEVQQAQDQLDQMELSYEKSLLAAGNQSAQENRGVQKARDAYNEALAVYNQYSNMEPSKLITAQAEAEAKLKQLQKASEKAEESYQNACKDADYLDAQARITELKEEIQTLDGEIEDYQTQIRELNMGGRPREKTVIATELSMTKSNLGSLQASKEALDNAHGENYGILSAICAGNTTEMERLCAKSASEQLEKALTDGGYAAEEDKEAAAENIRTAYLTMKDYYSKEAELEASIQALQTELELADSYATTQEQHQALEKKLGKAQSDLRAAQQSLQNVEASVSGFEKKLQQLKEASEEAKEKMDIQQDAVDSLSNASGAADTVKSCKQALEDLIFEQGLSDGSYLDLQAAKKEIEKQKEKIEKLMENADEQEVKAKVGGVVSMIYSSAGNTVGAESPLATINLVDRGYTIKIPVTVEQAKKVKVGDKAELLNYWGGDVEAVLESLANDPNNPGKGKLLVFRLTGDVEPNQNYTLSIGQKSAKYDCLVPNAAVRSDSNGSFVLALVAKSTPLSTRYIATRVDVQVQASDDTSSAVTGLSSGDFVITTSTKPIEAGTQVRLVDNG